MKNVFKAYNSKAYSEDGGWMVQSALHAGGCNVIKYSAGAAFFPPAASHCLCVMPHSKNSL